MSRTFAEVDRCECGHNKRKHTAGGCPYCGYAVCSETFEERDRMSTEPRFWRLVREQATWNRQNLAQGRLRAFASAWLDVRGIRAR